MTLEEAVESFRKRLEEQVNAFELNWRACRQTEPETFKSEMTKEEWDEQFAIFLENNL